MQRIDSPPVPQLLAAEKSQSELGEVLHFARNKS
jgi:hypothetical protein